jgi:dTDP-4-amino-4,6-dideoxygalactose transaminase
MNAVSLTIPFVKLNAKYFSIEEDIDKTIRDVIEQSAFIGGAAIKKFESAFAAYIGAKSHCFTLIALLFAKPL